MGGGALYSTIGDYLKLHAHDAGPRTLDGVPILQARDGGADVANSMGEVLCRPLKSQLPNRSTDMDFVDGMKWGLTFMINPQAFPGRRSADSLTWGGLANSYYWIDPVKKVTGVWAHPAAAVLRRARGGGVRGLRARGLCRPLMEVA